MSLKLHLGCGRKLIHGYVNVDLNREVNPDVIDNIFTLETFQAGTADYILCVHALEHLKRSDVHAAMRRWFEILKPGGMLRVAVPDIEAAMKWYSQTFRLEDIRGLLWGGQKNEFDYHCVGWDEKTLTTDLAAAGFVDIKRYDWRATEHFYIDDYSSAMLPRVSYKSRSNLNEKLEGLAVSLNMECKKPI